MDSKKFTTSKSRTKKAIQWWEMVLWSLKHEINPTQILKLEISVIPTNERKKVNQCAAKNESKSNRNKWRRAEQMRVN